ncbi:LysR family transcriptional regulator, partial [Klebsiella pneumoniae]
IAQLESKLDVQLLIRTAKLVSVTEVGKDFYKRALTILAAIEEAHDAAKKIRSEPKGILRITAGVESGVDVVSP